LNTRHDPKTTSRTLSVSHGAALTGSLARSGVIGPSILPAVERSLASSVLPDIESSEMIPARCTVLRPLLTSLQVAPLGSPHVRARCFPARPPHLPARPNRATSLCGASSSRRARPSMRFAGRSAPCCPFGQPVARKLAALSVSPLVSASLPSPGRLPFRSWPRVVGLSCHHAVPPTGDLHSIYNAPMMGAHQKVQVTSRSARNLTFNVGNRRMNPRARPASATPVALKRSRGKVHFLPVRQHRRRQV